jgi:hypothetical protein
MQCRINLKRMTSSRMGRHSPTKIVPVFATSVSKLVPKISQNTARCPCCSFCRCHAEAVATEIAVAVAVVLQSRSNGIRMGWLPKAIRLRPPYEGVLQALISHYSKNNTSPRGVPRRTLVYFVVFVLLLRSFQALVRTE